jgi:hypothetical protein
MADQQNEVGQFKNVKVMPVTTFLTHFTDGNDKEHTKLGFVIGPEVRFLDLKALSKPAQSWLRDELLVALGLKKPEEPKAETVSTPEAAPSDNGSPSLERQV